MSKKYVYHEGRALKGIKADEVMDELSRIEEKHGSFPEPKTIVDESRPDEAVLHPVFEWRDEIAAELYRERQARDIVRSVDVIKPDGTRHPAVVNVQIGTSIRTPGHRASSYERFEDVVADDAKLAMLLADMRRRIATAESALEEVRRAVWKGRGQEDLATVALLADALATARSLADRLH